MGQYKVGGSHMSCCAHHSCTPTHTHHITLPHLLENMTQPVTDNGVCNDILRLFTANSFYLTFVSVLSDIL